MLHIRDFLHRELVIKRLPAHPCPDVTECHGNRIARVQRA